jgi:hypothetical protein
MNKMIKRIISYEKFLNLLKPLRENFYKKDENYKDKQHDELFKGI